MIKVIVNGDDFGISRGVNGAIEEGFASGVLDRTTWMANMPFALEAVELSKEKGFAASVGLHLNLTSGKPLTGDISKLGRFCGQDGSFNAAFSHALKSRFFLTRAEEAAVRAEARTQIEKYLEAGFTLRHLDSHHHIHTDYSIWKIVEPLLKEYGLKSARISRNVGPNAGLIKRIYKRLYNARLKGLGIAASDFFGSYADSAEFLSGGQEPLEGRVPEGNSRTNRKPDPVWGGGLLEIMVHPMYSKEGVLVDSTGGITTPFSVMQAVLLSYGQKR